MASVHTELQKTIGNEHKNDYIGIAEGNMPTVLRVGPYRFFFFSRENNEPAHIHIADGDREAKVWIASLTLAYSYGFKPHEMAQLIAMVRIHQTTFQEAWNEYFTCTA